MEESFEKTNNVNKKLPLEELDRDELLKRCKSYLALAQRAKQARDGKCYNDGIGNLKILSDII
jgi:hypothetical protein